MSQRLAFKSQQRPFLINTTLYGVRVPVPFNRHHVVFAKSAKRLAVVRCARLTWLLRFWLYVYFNFRHVWFPQQPICVPSHLANEEGDGQTSTADERTCQAPKIRDTSAPHNLLDSQKWIPSCSAFPLSISLPMLPSVTHLCFCFRPHIPGFQFYKTRRSIARKRQTSSQ